MNNKLVAVVCAVIAAGTSVFISAKWFTPKIGYVRSAVIVEKYKGMIEARNVYKEKMGQWQANIDTLERDYKRAYNKFNSELPSLSKSQKQEREESLHRQEMNIRQYISTLEEKAKEEDGRLTEGVINQINSLIEEYGEKHGYDVILGSTLQGNILYGKKSRDITDEVLAELNNAYRGTSSGEKKE